MDFKEFKKELTEFPYEQSNKIREKYIQIFVDITSEHYSKYILTTKRYSDGECYIGYLWDCLKNHEEIPYDDGIRYILDKNLVNVLWDIHSKENILIENYWKFNKDTILKLESETLIKGLSTLPEDIYVFDESFDWTIVFTHEYRGENKICFKCIK